MRKVEVLPTRHCEAGYGPALGSIQGISVQNDAKRPNVLICVSLY